MICVSDSDFGTSAQIQITVNPPGGMTCIDFTDLVVDDNVALEGDEAFAIMILGTSAMAMVTILDDDGECIFMFEYSCCSPVFL